MNRNVYTLLVAAMVASVLNVAQAETMADRKQRIMRKYMRERQDIMQSDLGVPDAAQEDSRVVESEQFKEPSLEFQRQKGGVAPPPSVRPLPVQQPERSWWLETAEMEEDPYADPFSSHTDAREGSEDSWSPWGKRDDSSAYDDGAYGQQRNGGDDTYSGHREGSPIYGGDSSQQWDGRGDTYPGGQSVYGRQSESRNRSSVSGMTYDGYTVRRVPTSRDNDRTPGFYGRQQTDTRGTDSGWGVDSAVRYGSSPSSGLLQTPFSSPASTQDWSLQNQTPGYTPYRSPFQIQGDEQRRYGGDLQPQQPQYSRPNNYEKWKDTNKAWDPTTDNSYLDELMRNQRR